MQAQGGSRGIGLLIHNLGARWGWVVNTTPWPLYPEESSGTCCLYIPYLPKYKMRFFFQILHLENWVCIIILHNVNHCLGRYFPYSCRLSRRGGGGVYLGKYGIM
jgi:hypothetical protein